MPDGIEDRTADCWEPLLAIADVAADWTCGAHWPERAREAAVYLTGAAKDDLVTTGVELLAHIREHFLEATKIHTSTLLERLHNRDESPWLHMGRTGRPLNDRKLADMLHEYDIKSRDVKIDGTNRKGYQREDFEDAFRRYLEPAPLSRRSATGATSATNLSNKDNSVAPVAPVALPEKKGANGVAYVRAAPSKPDVIRLTAELLDSIKKKTGDAA
jgi:hypothetical protein